MCKLPMSNTQKVFSSITKKRVYEETLSRLHIADEDVLGAYVYTIDHEDYDLYYYQIDLYLGGQETITRRVGYPKEECYVGFNK